MCVYMYIQYHTLLYIYMYSVYRHILCTMYMYTYTHIKYVYQCIDSLINWLIDRSVDCLFD